MRLSIRPTVTALLISTAVSGLLCVWAVSAAPSSIRTPLAWCSGAAAVLLVAAVTVAARALGAGRELRRHNAALAEQAEKLSADMRRAAEDVRIARTEAQRAGEAAALANTLRASASATGANIAGRIQAIVTGMLADLRDMENRYGDENILSDLLQLDHRTAQAGRLADSVAVLTGARSGRRWAKPIVMESILRGAMGRISGYQRVRIHSTSTIAVAGHAAEGVMHALAELLDNAANFSPLTAEVHVYVEEVPAGVVITVEDSGLVMSDVQLRRAEQAVTSDVKGLAAVHGSRLGLSVVGRLARKHGLTVSFRPSARGGTGALLMLPRELLTRDGVGAPAQPLPRAHPAERAKPPVAAAPASVSEAPEPEPEPVRAPETATAAPTATAPAPDAGPGTAAAHRSADESAAPGGAEDVEIGESGLPLRRRGRTLAAARRRTVENGKEAGANTRSTSPNTPSTTAPTSSDSTTQATRFGDFLKAVRAPSPQQADTTPPEGNSR
ncbi:ATP-binding protein [Streptomyces sp. NPDC088725]|uniref:ATP-binding protein n=1 Tax=Streptomyces sp. NPDC088725 TaxID=3365873 RepID=UPI00381DC8E8